MPAPSIGALERIEAGFGCRDRKMEGCQQLTYPAPYPVPFAGERITCSRPRGVELAIFPVGEDLQIRTRMMARCGGDCVPQILIDEGPVGELDELEALSI